MVRYMRCGRIAPGKTIPAVLWAKEIIEYMNKKYKIKMTLYGDILGDNGMIRIFCDYEDLATMEKFSNKLTADQEYWKKLNKGADLFIPGSDSHMAMRSI